MVTGPDLSSADEAAQYLIRLRQLLRWLEISEADMEKGHLRCDANVSIRPMGLNYLNPKTEIKNVNSIDAVRQAIQTEVERQKREVSAGRPIEAWTLEWDEDLGALHKMRSKETEADYRYFREPDLLPLLVDSGMRKRILGAMVELPLERRARFVMQYELPEYDAEILTEERSLSEYFEATLTARPGEAKTISNWMMNDVMRMLRERSVTASRLRLRPEHLAAIIGMVEGKLITTNTGKELLEKVEESGRAPADIVAAEGLSQVSDDSRLRSLAEEVVAESPDQLKAYRNGKTSLIGWFVGQVMRKTGGKAEPQRTRAILEDLLSE